MLLHLVAAVTFAAPTDAAARLLPKLGMAMGMRLEADRLAGVQVLLVRVQAMDRDRLLKLVAEATGGTWRTIEGGYRLTLGDEETKALWKEETALRTAAFERAILGLDASIRPAARALGAATLAGIRPGTRVVWSTSPTRLQRSLPKEALAFARPAIERERSRIELARQAGHDVGEAFDFLSRTPATLLVTARRGRHATALGLMMTAYTEDGTPFAGTAAMLRLPEAPRWSAELPGEPLAVGREAEAWADGFEKAPTDGSLLDAIFHPERREPLGLGGGPALDALARQAGKGVVACLPDTAYGVMAGPIRVRFPAREWPRALDEERIAARTDGDTVVFRPLDRAQAAEDRADRTTMRARFADIEANGSPTFALPAPSGIEVEAMCAFDSHYRYVMDVTGGTMQEAWRTLAPLQRRAAFEGEASAPSAFLDAMRRAEERPDDESDHLLSRGGLSMEPTVLFAPVGGFLAATRVEIESALVRSPDARVPTVASLNGLAQRIAAGEAPYRDPKTRYWPACTTQVGFVLHLGADRKFNISGTMSENVRSSPSATSYPNLFPSLREAVRRKAAGG